MLSINKPLTAKIKKRFISCYAEEFQSQLNNGIPIQEVNIYMPISKMKSLAAQQVVGVFDYLQENDQFAVNSFKETNI